MADHVIEVSRPEGSDAHTSQESIAVAVSDTVKWGSEDSHFRITFSGGSPFSESEFESEAVPNSTPPREETGPHTVTNGGTFEYAVASGSIASPGFGESC
jgi:plastocyanin